MPIGKYFAREKTEYCQKFDSKGIKPIHSALVQITVTNN